MKNRILQVILLFVCISFFPACDKPVTDATTPEEIILENKVEFNDFSVGRNDTKVGVIGRYVYLHVGISSALDIEEIKVYIQKSESDETLVSELESFKREKETELIEEIPVSNDIAPGKYYLVVSVLDKNKKETKIGSEVELKHFMAYEVEVISDVYALNNKILVLNSASGMFSIDELLSSYPMKEARVEIKKSDSQEWVATKDITADVKEKTEVKELISSIMIDTSLLPTVEDEDADNWGDPLYDSLGECDMYLLLEDVKGNKDTLLIAQITVKSSFVEIGKSQISSSKQAENDMKLFPEGQGFISIDSIKSTNKDYYISMVSISFYQESTETSFFHELYNYQIDNKQLIFIKDFVRTFPVGTSTLGKFTPTLVVESKPLKGEGNLESSFILEEVEVITKQ